MKTAATDLRPCGCSVIRSLTQLLLFLFLLVQASVGTSSELLLELVDTASGINEFQLTGIERVTVIADVNFQLGLHALGGK